MNTCLTDAFSYLPDGISADLCRTVGTTAVTRDALGTAFHKLSILTQGESLLSYRDISVWQRRGAETFIAEFSVVIGAGDGIRWRHYVAKALVAWGIPPDQQVTRWVKRCDLLRSAGVHVPECIPGAPGVVLQTYIPHSFLDIWMESGVRQRQALAHAALRLAAKLDRVGFLPVSLVEDLRSDGSDLYIVDFGADLGEPVLDRTGSSARTLTRKWLRSHWQDEVTDVVSRQAGTRNHEEMSS